MFRPLLICRKTGVVEHVRPAAKFEELCPLPVVIRHNRNKAVFGRVRPPPRINRPRIAHLAIAGDEGFAPQIFDHVKPGETFEHRHLHELSALTACPCQQSRHRRVSGKQTADLIGDKRRGICRSPPIALLRQCGKARRGLNEIVVSLPVAICAARAEACAVDIDDVGVDRFHFFITEAQPLHSRKPHIVDEHIGVFEQRFQHRLVLGLFDVEVDCFFVAVERCKNRAVLLGRRIARVAHQVARRIAFRILDLDNLCTQVGKIYRGKGAEHDSRHIDHLDAF